METKGEEGGRVPRNTCPRPREKERGGDEGRSGEAGEFYYGRKPLAIGWKQARDNRG